MSDLMWAVVDDPDGDHAVELPDDQMPAIRLRERHSGKFWCAKRAGGCGGLLTLRAGSVLRPHFAHRAKKGCAYEAHGSRAARRYDHLRYQRALEAWLATRGFFAKLECDLGGDGRTDLHVVVESVSHALEVQLSQLPATSWADRDARYRRRVDHVAWLYGPNADAEAATEIAQRGLCLRIRATAGNRTADTVPGQHLAGKPAAEPDTGVAAPGVELASEFRVELGVEDIDRKTEYTPLAGCSITAAGLQVPGLEAARARRDEHQREQAAAEAAAREEKRRQGHEREQEKARREQLRRQLVEEARQAQLRRQASAVPPDPLAGKPDAPLKAMFLPGDGLRQWRMRNPEAEGWEPAQGWAFLNGLPPSLHQTAVAIAYATQVLVAASITTAVLRDWDDAAGRTTVFNALQRQGFVTLKQLPSGKCRWQRCTRPASLLTRNQVDGR